MQVHKLVQGSPEWTAHRARYFNASDAPAMMGVSPYETRDQLIHRLATGIAPEVDAMTQRRFDDGHRYEALARPLAEAIIGEPLYPVVATEGKLSASSDGLTMDDSTNFEHKSLNDELRAIMTPDCTGADLPIYHRVQQEQQHMVFGCEKTLFMASKWEGETLIEERHCWYTGDAELATRIDAGWVLLEQDVAAYVLPAASAPAPTGRAPETLPALLITVKGEVTASNLAEFKETALTAIRSVNRELTNDQQFADAEKAVKWCDDIEKRVAGAKEHALSQTATIDQLFKALDDISAEARQTRLDLEKLVKARKEAIRGEIVADGVKALAQHIDAMNARLGKTYMPISAMGADFAGAIKGKRTVDSLRDAVNTTLATAKIAASATADRIDANLKTLRELAKDHAFLFADTPQLVLKANDDLTALVKQRIAEHVDAEAKKAAAAPAPTPVAALVANVVQMPTPHEAAARILAARLPEVQKTPPTLKLGQIGERLGFSLTGDFLKNLGFEPAARDKAALLFHESDFPLICMRLVSHIQGVRDKQAA